MEYFHNLLFIEIHDIDRPENQFNQLNKTFLVLLGNVDNNAVIYTTFFGPKGTKVKVNFGAKPFAYMERWTADDTARLSSILINLRRGDKCQISL